MKKKVTDLSFDDSELISFNYEKTDLKVTIKSWDERKITIIFRDAINVKFKSGDWISEFCEITNATEIPEFNENINRIYEDEKLQNKLKLYRIIDIDDSCVLEIISEECKVTKGTEYI